MKTSGGIRKWMAILALVFFAHASSVCISIRYGFLADAFASRNISGKIYGLIGTSVFAGFLFMFVFQITEKFMMKWNSRTIMISNMLGWAMAALITGFAYCISDTTAVIIISFAMRIIQGLLAYPSTLVPVDFINANFPEEFDMVYGLVNLGYYSGHGLAEVVGCLLYEKFSYEFAYAFSAFIALLAAASGFIFLPSTETHLSTQANPSDEDQIIESMGSKNVKLSMYLIAPLIATMLINANYGVIQVTVTPYLKEEFHKTISYGGMVLTMASVGMAIGSVTQGLILQKKVLNHFTVMGIGALCIFTGLMLTYPPESISALHNLAPITAFPGVLIAGIGDPLMTIATLRALYDIQLKERGLLTPRVTTKITGIWIIGYCSMYFSGSFIAGTLTDYLSYSTTAEILAGLCLLAMIICSGMRLCFNNKEEEDEDNEKMALIP